MGRSIISKRSLMVVICIILCVVMGNLQQGMAIRQLRDDQQDIGKGGSFLAMINKLKNNNNSLSLLFELLPKGSPTQTGASPCTYIPGGKGHC